MGGLCCGESIGGKELLYARYFSETKIVWDKNTVEAIVSDCFKS